MNATVIALSGITALTAGLFGFLEFESFDNSRSSGERTRRGWVRAGLFASALVAATVVSKLDDGEHPRLISWGALFVIPMVSGGVVLFVSRHLRK